MSRPKNGMPSTWLSWRRGSRSALRVIRYPRADLVARLATVVDDPLMTAQKTDRERFCEASTGHLCPTLTPSWRPLQPSLRPSHH